MDRLNSRGATLWVALENLEGEIIRQALKRNAGRIPQNAMAIQRSAASGERKVLDPSGAVPLRRGTFLPQDVDARAKLVAVCTPGRFKERGRKHSRETAQADREFKTAAELSPPRAPAEFERRLASSDALAQSRKPSCS